MIRKKNFSSTLWQITCSGKRPFCAGLIATDRVIEAAPILHYMKGWPTDKMLAYAKRKGWRARSCSVDQYSMSQHEQGLLDLTYD